ncbi:MAG: AAA family ATPase [Pirellulales bacterium]
MNWNELANAPIDEVLAWAEEQPWCQAMKQCEQDTGWHSEGDVWTHTKMVCSELVALDEWSNLSASEQTVLLFTALFHDAAKPLTTQIDPVKGRTTSPKHAVKGEHLARAVLRDVGCRLPVREEIARMVRYHGRPAFLLEREQPSHEVIGLSWLVSNKLLYLFAVADTRGRTTAEMTRPEENLHLWKMVAEENGCFNEPYPFANHHARFMFYRQRRPNLHYVPHENYSCTVTVLSGLPGSGKDRWLARDRSEEPIVSLDDIRSELKVAATDNQGDVIQTARERCRELLRSGTSFAFNATNVVKQTRQRWIDLFADYDARIDVIYIEPALGAILRQNAQRQHPVPEDVIRDLAAKTEVPTWAECHELSVLDETE